MKVCCLDQYFKTREMAGGTRGYEMARLLIGYGHEVVVVTTDRGKGARPGWRVSHEEGIEVHWAGIPYSNEMSFQQRFRSFLRFAMVASTKATELGGDVVFATSTPLTIALPAVRAKRRLRVPMVFEVRDLWPELPIAIGALRNPLNIAGARWLERFAYRNADRVVALSPGMKDGVVAAGYPEERVAVIPNSADIELFRVPRNVGLSWRREHPEVGDRPMVLYAGTLGRMNGVEWLARVAGAAVELDPAVCFVVVGEGSERDKVIDVARDLGVQDRNFFLFPAAPKRDMPALLSAATVSTSLFVDIEAMRHNSANKFFDALASARPVAINYGGWQAHLLQEFGAGIRLPVADAQAAARTLIARVHDRGWVAASGRAAGRLAEERFNRVDLARRLEDVLSRAITDQGAG